MQHGKQKQKCESQHAVINKQQKQVLSNLVKNHCSWPRMNQIIFGFTSFVMDLWRNDMLLFVKTVEVITSSHPLTTFLMSLKMLHLLHHCRFFSFSLLHCVFETCVFAIGNV